LIGDREKEAVDLGKAEHNSPEEGCSMENDARHGWQANAEEAGGGQRKNWGEDSREERHPDPEPAPPGSPAPDRARDPVDEESDESFPASDPPSFTPTKIG
jgi:hypothetical protein